MTPSSYQLAIYEWLLFGDGNGAVNAVAGSGKTTTLVGAAEHIEDPNDILFLAFNKSIVLELEKRLPYGAKVQTLNSLGHNALGRNLGMRLMLDGHKYSNLILDLVQQGAAFGSLNKEGNNLVKRAVSQLVSLAQADLCDPTDEALSQIVSFHDLEFDIPGAPRRAMFEVARQAMWVGEEQGSRDIISYEDQIWLPVKWGIKPAQSRFVFVDECQDLSKAKTELALMSVAHDGRLLFVGDRRQAIYGFAGADSASFGRIVERTNAEVLPLSISYRCPRKVVAEAQQIVPEIESHEHAEEGVVEAIWMDDFYEKVRPGDMVICRVTAPLVSLCIRLIRRRIRAHVRGRDIGRGLIDMAKSARKQGEWSNFGTLLDKYYHDKRDRLLKRENVEAELQSLEDRISGLRICYEEFQAQTFQEFCQQIEELFSDNEEGVSLSTVHRAKGLEADRVFIIEPQKLPLVWKGQLEWQYEQEKNLKYVAVTRAKRELYYVWGKKEKREEARKKSLQERATGMRDQYEEDVFDEDNSGEDLNAPAPERCNTCGFETPLLLESPLGKGKVCSGCHQAHTAKAESEKLPILSWLDTLAAREKKPDTFECGMCGRRVDELVPHPTGSGEDPNEVCLECEKEFLTDMEGNATEIDECGDR